MSHDLRDDYLAAYRRSVATPKGVQSNNLGAVLDRAAAMEADPPRQARWAASALVFKISTVVLLGTGLGYLTVRTTAAPSTKNTERASATAPAPRSDGALTTPPPPPATEPIVAAPPARPADPAPPRRAKPAPATPKPAAEDPLRQELLLLEAAQTHLHAGRIERATQSLREHARRFPQGTLATERTAWRAIIACAGEGPQPKAAARSFLLTHGDSPLGAKVKAECKL